MSKRSATGANAGPISLAGEVDAVELELDALEERAVGVVRVLLEVDDVAAVLGHERGHRGDDAGPVRARHEQDGAPGTQGAQSSAAARYGRASRRRGCSRRPSSRASGPGTHRFEYWHSPGSSAAAEDAARAGRARRRTAGRCRRGRPGRRRGSRRPRARRGCRPPRARGSTPRAFVATNRLRFHTGRNGAVSPPEHVARHEHGPLAPRRGDAVRKRVCIALFFQIDARDAAAGQRGVGEHRHLDRA